MLSASRLLRVGPVKSAAPVQQCLFTGALFPADTNRDLCAFAELHNVTSNVWVPHRAFDHSLKQFDVFILPCAALCDTATSGGSAQLSRIPRVLVNAAHTSNQKLFEKFTELLVATPGAVYMGAGATFDRDGAQQQQPDDIHGGTAGGDSASRPSVRAMRTVRHIRYPIAADGMAILDAKLFKLMVAYKEKHGFLSNYWHVPSPVRAHHHNAEEDDAPGRLNPTATNQYSSVSLSGRPFPREVRHLMRQRAGECGYVSAVWVTMAEAAGLFGTRLRPERAQDAPLVCLGNAVGEPVALYCADQFEDSERLFPSAREIALALKGVLISPEKMRGFPLLHRLHLETSVAARTADAGKVGLSKAGPGPTRSGADTTMMDARRHMRLSEETGRLRKIRVLGLPTRDRERTLLQADDLGARLLDEAVLRGYPTPHFVGLRQLALYQLRVRRGELGYISHPKPARLWDDAWLDGDVYFNIAQLAEPLVALQLQYSHPTHLLTRRWLSRALATHCAQVQVRMGYASCEWVPLFAAHDAGWRPRPGAPSVPFPPRSIDWDYPSKPRCHAEYALVNVKELGLPAEAIEFLRTYRPVDAHGCPYLRMPRALMTLRAWEQGYRSPVWVPAYPDSDYICNVRPAAGGGDGSSLARADSHLAGDAFLTVPLIRYRGTHFVNAEDVQNLDPATIVVPPPLRDLPPMARLMEQRGEGPSAERFLPAKYQPGSEPDDDEDNSGDKPPPEDVFDSSYDIPMTGF